MNKKIIIAGAGGIGSATGLLLRETGDIDVDLYIGDARESATSDAAGWISDGSFASGDVEPFTMPLEGTNESIETILKQGDIILDCLPGTQAPRIALWAREHNLHYANLTEYVAETEKVKEIAKGAESGYILQTGLAPGFINVLANGLFQQFCEEFKVDKADTISMKVGALTRNASPPHQYGFTWSPVGVATEYLEPAEGLREFQKAELLSLTERGSVVIEGVTYEEAITSGGAADLPEALAGRVRNLDYKTLRYPGHYSWIDTLLESIEGPQKIEQLQERMELAVPLVQDDIVIIYAGVSGKDHQGNHHIKEQTFAINPIKLGMKTLRAIQATTAAGLAESARLLLNGEYKGVVLQSKIDPKTFMGGPFVSKVYNQQ